MTMSPVLDVVIQAPNGSPLQAVLKLFDRRFGEDLRRVYKQSACHTPAREAAFHAFIRQGKMAPFLREVDEAHETELIPPSPAGFLGEGTEGPAKYEAAQWRECREHFRCETKAYAQLSDLQGELIPRMLAHVRLVSGGDFDVPPDLRETGAPYFELNGILLERIDGYKLEDMTSLLTTRPPKNLKEWQIIIQAAANAAHVINERGILMQDASPRNVMVDRRSQTPRIIDFAQCLFRDELVDQWHRWEWQEDEEWDPDVEYWERARQQEDPAAIALVH
ncbi:hypothetical protein NEMBOFW57_007010 [Staphylotrichum longicolle]|uniref:Protein kinase domain-containing protein n=1 Tax=Staphylotrichum longicolle TaxID=669026 RepID=A0AAD4EYC0_9PEZI|nr:hypothetical protein NEMBOFW57_007010 [Staphylotrichum longicolle]